MTRELLVIKKLDSGLRTKELSSGETFSIKSGDAYKIGDLETITFDVEKEWTFKKQNYITGNILKHEFILSNIEVEGLDYESDGIWDPFEMFEDDAEEYFADYIKEGYRESFIFADYSGYGFYNPGEDPISDAVELKEQGEWEKAYKKLATLWEDYPQCIDALVHIGNMRFEGKRNLEEAYHCYQTAGHIEKKKMPKDMDGIFLWGCIENRPYLRALHGLCLMLWRREKFDEALTTANKILRTSPTDELGTRFCIENIKNREEWTDEEE